MLKKAHESIRPTNINIENVEDNETMGKYERRVYKLIRRNTLESCMSAATFKSINFKNKLHPKIIYIVIRVSKLFFQVGKKLQVMKKTSPDFCLFTKI